MCVKWLDEKREISSAMTLFVTTALFCFVGSHLRMPQELSLFWPVNALLTGIIVRFPWLHRTRNYFVCYTAMVLNDTIFSGWTGSAFTINFANILFVFVAAAILLASPPAQDGNALRVGKAMRIFAACLIASIGCASWGALAQGEGMNEKLITAWSDWFSEQFSTGVLLLPFLLTLKRQTTLSRAVISTKMVLPVIALILSVCASAMIGGAGSLSFPLPAMIWCAIRLPIVATTLLMLITGITEIILVVDGIITIQGGDSSLPLSHLMSARLGVATLAIGPFIVSVSMDAIRRLNHQLALRADYDFLTRLLSRSGLYEQLRGRETASCQRAGVMIIDIDYFKSINDSFGHDAGDAVLEELAQRLRHVVGDRGLLCRFGGEEFVAVFFNVDREALWHHAESIRQAIEQEKFVLQGNTVNITVSIGIACQHRLSGKDRISAINGLISAADKNLYYSKRNGRNQTSPALHECVA